MTNLNKFKDYLKDKSIDAAIINDEINVRYLGGFSFSDGLLFITSAESYLLTDFRYYEMALKAVGDTFKVLTPKSIEEKLKELVCELHIKSLGVEFDKLTHKGFLKYQNSLKVELIDLCGCIEKQREIKTEDEIADIKRAQSITDKAFSHLLSMITSDMTELDVACELEYAMKRNGAEGFAFDTISVSGDASALPHGTPRPVKLKKGFLTMDFGAKYNGYCSDMTRTIVVGKADNEMKKLYNTVLRAQSEALAFLREGADCGLCDKVARDVINVDYPNTFGHSLGHSVGLYIHESPRLSARAFGEVLIENQVLTVEPGIYIFEKYGCRIEDMVVICKGGIKNLTHSSKELIEIY